MALKKSELYSSLWSSCDALRGGMDASQYKDYVLVLLFIKYVSDKYAGQPFAPIAIPPGASFADMVKLKGKSNIGDLINTTIVAPLAEANRLTDLPDFNDPGKLGSGKEMVDRLTDLIAIFENPALDFSKNRAEGDDILGDAYEYLMRHFATESGKSKGQFYTPAEVSRVVAQVLGIRLAKTSRATTVYDPTCGSGSLLLKVADEARTPLTLEGQEKDGATAGLARMNMILHNNPTARVEQGNTLAHPQFTDKAGQLKTYDYVVANPPFSDKKWTTGLSPANDPFGRFEGYGVPPDKQGDYAYLLHIVRSLKSTGQAACILPHGVLFRGNAEADIRRNLVQRGLIKGLIGLPANLFYGTGIPACIVVLDKREAHTRASQGTGIYMVDASRGYAKDGPKNRLRDRDIHQIVDVFTRQAHVPGYARPVPLAEIARNDFNLNLPRYIHSGEREDQQDINAHLNGGIPQADVDAEDSALQPYWAACPALRAHLFQPLRPGYLQLAVPPAGVQASIHLHADFVALTQRLAAHFAAWRSQAAATLSALQPGCHPKDVVAELAESLLAHYQGQPLIDPYAVYQHLLDYWAATMQDDCYAVATDGWQAQTRRVTEQKKGKDGQPGKQVDKGWACDLLPKPLLVAQCFAAEQAAIDQLAAALEAASAQLAELEEEHSGEDAVFSGYDKVNAAAVKERLAEIKGDADADEERAVLQRWQALVAEETRLKKQIKDAEAALDAKACAHYPTLSEAQVTTLVVQHKWLAALEAAAHGELDRVSQRLTQRVKELAGRYESKLSELSERVAELEGRVAGHLQRMGYVWK
jgi:type I restriction enzyme M protein